MRRGHSHPDPTCYRRPLSARSVQDPFAGYCHSSNIGRQAGENSLVLPFAFPPTDRSGTDRLFRRNLPVLLAGDLNAKQVECKSRLNTRRWNLLHDYGDENSYLIFRPDTLTTNPFNYSATTMSWTS